MKGGGCVVMLDAIDETPVQGESGVN